MPKRARLTTTPEIVLDAALSTPLYQQLYGRLRAAILAGQLERGARLPSTRTLASELGVSRNTVALAYDQLLMEGYIESRVGDGTRVSPQLPDFVATPLPTRPRSPHPEPSGPIATRMGALHALYHPEHATRASALFRGGTPALDRFPYALWARLISRHARKSLPQYAAYQTGMGHQPLREAIAAHIGITRGVRCTPDQIIITAGSQGALDLVIRTLLNVGDAAWVENPGYFGAHGALVAAGARLIPVPVDEQGLVVAQGQARCPTARLVATTPSHQFPTGVTMTLARRVALLEWARAAEAWILEDDYDGEYRYGGRPVEALQGLDQAQRVIYIGTFSKVLFPALRLGYLVAPPSLIEPLLAMRRYIDMHAPILEQLALTDFMVEGHFARHLRHMLQHYRQRRDALAHALRTHLGGLLDVAAPEVGMHLVGWLPVGVDDRRAAQLATDAGLHVTALSSYALEPLPRGALLFGFASTAPDAMPRGVEMLAQALTTLKTGEPRG